MIALDTSSLIAFFEGQPGRDVDRVYDAFAGKHACLPPAVLTELLSDPHLPGRVVTLLHQLPLLLLLDGYWQRAGLLRAKVLTRKRKARLGDVLIAQSCLDHNVTLVTRDSDFQTFAEVAGLSLGSNERRLKK